MTLEDSAAARCLALPLRFAEPPPAAAASAIPAGARLDFVPPRVKSGEGIVGPLIVVFVDFMSYIIIAFGTYTEESHHKQQQWPLTYQYIHMVTLRERAERAIICSKVERNILILIFDRGGREDETEQVSPLFPGYAV